jgi:UV DNA damage endonuclease
LWRDPFLFKNGTLKYINITDVPPSWLSMNITAEVEAKAKELALQRLMSDLNML